MSPIRRSVLEQKAKLIQKLKGLKWTKALDEACREAGYANYKHYINSTKNVSTPSLEKLSQDNPLNFAELFRLIENTNIDELRQKSKEFEFNHHIQNQILDLFQNRFLSVGAFIPNENQRLHFDFLSFDYSIREGEIAILVKVLISITTPTGELYEYKGAMKSNNQYDCEFNLQLNSEGAFSVAENGSKIIGRAF